MQVVRLNLAKRYQLTAIHKIRSIPSFSVQQSTRHKDLRRSRSGLHSTLNTPAELLHPSIGKHTSPKSQLQVKILGRTSPLSQLASLRLGFHTRCLSNHRSLTVKAKATSTPRATAAKLVV